MSEPAAVVTRDLTKYFTAADVSNYRIYRVIGGVQVFLADVGAGLFEYLDRNVSKTQEYRYAITTVDKDSEESDPV